MNTIIEGRIEVPFFDCTSLYVCACPVRKWSF